ncbi:hypothetical protein TKK_0016314 [Trichogramma kaykai]
MRSLMKRGRGFENQTLDINNKGCFQQYDGIACGRISILVVLSLVTLIFVIMKIIKYHKYKHSPLQHYALFYLAALQCMICIVCFLIGNTFPQFYFILNFFKLYQFISICYIYWSMAAESRHRDDITQHVIIPGLFLYTLFCVAVAIMGTVDYSSSSWNICFRPFWLILSGADFIAVQIFAIVALYLTSKNTPLVVSALMMPSTSSQTRDLWLITAVYEIAAVVSVVFDTSMIMFGTDEGGCSGVFYHDQLYYSPIIFVATLIKFFVPTWTLLGVFQPSTVKSRPSEVALTSHYNTDGSCRNQFHRMFMPNFSQTIPYPDMSYPTSSPMFGAIGDFSDSSPDSSPVIPRYWTGLDDDSFCGYDKHFVNVDQHREMLNNQYRMEQNRQNLERSLGYDQVDSLNSENNSYNSDKKPALTTIKEENVSTTDNLPE